MRSVNLGGRTTVVVLGLVHAFLAMPAPGVAQTDTTPPQLVSFTFSPASIDTTTGAQSVAITARVTDDISGVAVFCASFRSPSGQQVIGNCFARVSGTTLDGIWEGAIHFPTGVEAGMWHLADGHVLVGDQVNNNRTYLESELLALGFPTTLQVNTTPRISNTTPARLWVGLKNSDDQGTQFDVRVALYVNDTLVAKGETLCVTGITRNAALATEVFVPFGSISNGEVIPGDRLSLQISARIGTNPDGSKCAGHSNASGLRLYYDAATRSSRIGVEITPDPLTDHFLRSINNDLLLDSALPTAEKAKHEDSGPLKFAKGNAWVQIGTWSRVLQ